MKCPKNNCRKVAAIRKDKKVVIRDSARKYRMSLRLEEPATFLMATSLLRFVALAVLRLT